MNVHRVAFSPSILAALGAAALFGVSTPLTKQLVGDLPAMLLAGLLYLGSGIGLSVMRLVRDRGWRHPGLPRHEWPWLLGAVLFGGIAGPTFLMLGLVHVSAAVASLLLNLEAVLTVALAWLAFKEHVDRRILLGMLLIVTGGIALSWPSAGITAHGSVGLLYIASACFCWAIDNNLTRNVSASDALFIAGTKGVVAGAVNVSLALLLFLDRTLHWRCCRACVLPRTDVGHVLARGRSHGLGRLAPSDRAARARPSP
jgi:drug/metabolite transporter (DMT)-like permease